MRSQKDAQSTPSGWLARHAWGGSMSARIAGMTPLRASRLGWLVLTVVVVLVCASSASASAAGWEVVSTSNTTVRAGDQLTYYVDLINRSNGRLDGSPFTLTATLPSGVTGVSYADSFTDQGVPFGPRLECGTVAGQTVIVCTANPIYLSFEILGQPDEVMEARITVAVDGAASGVRTARFDMTGGGIADGSTVDPVTISDTPPSFGIDAFDGQVRDAAGAPYTQAGGHPFDLATELDINTATDTSPTPGPLPSIVGDIQPVETLKDVVVELPPGLVGNPTGIAQCSGGELSNTQGVTPLPLCAATSQVGAATFIQNGTKLGNVIGPVPIFNMAPPPGVPARFGMNVAGTVVVLDASVRTGSDYGLTVTSLNAPAGVAINAAHVEFWGVPSDPIHDSERSCPGQPAASFPGGPSCVSGAPRAPFFRLPTSCTAPGAGLTTTGRVDSWEHPNVFKQASFVSHLDPGYPFSPNDPTTPWGAPIGPQRCDRVPFTPVFDAQPFEVLRAGGPATLAFDISIPQTVNPDETAGQSDLRKAVVTLPAGVHVNPSSAEGLGACDSSQIALRSAAPPTCPDASKIGTVAIDTPLLDVPVTGAVYLAKPFDNPFNSLVAVYLVASAKGVVIKLPGSISMDPNTGQITSTFDNNPQLPFSRLHVEFKSGPRAPLAVPNSCGVYTTHAELTGWNGRTVSTDSRFTLSENARGRPCPPEFTPSFSAGTVTNGGGTPSPFLLGLGRDDEDQTLSDLLSKLSRGLTGVPALATECTDLQANTNTCPPSSKIGDVVVGAGAGINPFYIRTGQAYLTVPYKGGKFGVAIVVPAVAGPFDLGMVTVRSALVVNDKTAQVSIVSDPFPTVLQGIPLDVRDVQVNINKPGFFLNPTSCAVKRITAKITSTEGTVAHVSDRFQAAECDRLGLHPRIVPGGGARGHTRRGKTIPFSTKLTMPTRGQANLRLVRVTLPKTLNARLTVIQDACTRAEFEHDITKCAHARAGTAKAVTPLLRDPLKGSAYFVKNGHPIPDLFIALRGEVDFDLIGRITIVNNVRLRTTFAAVPDVPVRSFSLRLFGDPTNGSVGAAANLCTPASRHQKVEIDYIGQNGKTLQTAQALKVRGCNK